MFCRKTTSMVNPREDSRCSLNVVISGFDSRGPANLGVASFRLSQPGFNFRQGVLGGLFPGGSRYCAG